MKKTILVGLLATLTMATLVLAVENNQYTVDSGAVEIYAPGGGITLRANGDRGEYIEFETSANIPYLTATSAEQIRFRDEDSGAAAGNIRMDFSTAGLGLYGYSDDIKRMLFLKYNATENSGALLISNNGGNIWLHADDDDSNYLEYSVYDGTPAIGVKGKSELLFWDGSDWDALNASDFNDMVADTAEKYYQDNNKGILENRLKPTNDGRLDIIDANPNVYFDSGNGNYGVSVGEGVVDNALKIDEILTVMQLMADEICSLKPASQFCTKDVDKIIAKKWVTTTTIQTTTTTSIPVFTIQ